MKRILLILMLITFMTGCGNESNEETVVNTNSSDVIYQNSNENVNKKQEVEGIIFDNIMLKTNNSMSFFTANVTNTNAVKVDLKYIKVTAYDKNENKILTFSSYIGDSIDINQTLKLSSNIEGDLTNIYSIKYEIIK